MEVNARYVTLAAGLKSNFIFGSDPSDRSDQDRWDRTRFYLSDRSDRDS